MDATWIAVIVGVISSLITGLIVGLSNFYAVKTSLARMEERQVNLSARCEEDRDYMHTTKETHEKRLAAHELEIGRLNWAVNRGGR